MVRNKALGTAWHANGKKMSSIHWRNDLKEGNATEWYDNGNLKEKGFFRNGKTEGDAKTWHKKMGN